MAETRAFVESTVVKKIKPTLDELAIAVYAFALGFVLGYVAKLLEVI